MFGEDASECETEALDNIASAIRTGLKYLGNADASTPMGALEAHGKAITDSADTIVRGLESIAEAINRLAMAVELIQPENTDRG